MHIAKADSHPNLVATSSKLFEYELAVYAGAEVECKVKFIQKEFGEQFGQVCETRDRPSITIATFRAREAMEETLIRYIHRICIGQKSFFVELNNFGGYPPSTVFLRVQDPKPFQQLIRELQPIHEYINSCSCPALKTVSYPHINIASMRSEQLYLPALMEYGQKSFYEVFMVSQLFLLRRLANGGSPKVVNVFGLQPGSQTLYN